MMILKGTQKRRKGSMPRSCGSSWSIFQLSPIKRLKCKFCPLPIVTRRFLRTSWFTLTETLKSAPNGRRSRCLVPPRTSSTKKRKLWLQCLKSTSLCQRKDSSLFGTLSSCSCCDTSLQFCLTGFRSTMRQHLHGRSGITSQTYCSYSMWPSTASPPSRIVRGWSKSGSQKSCATMRRDGC